MSESLPPYLRAEARAQRRLMAEIAGAWPYRSLIPREESAMEDRIERELALSTAATLGEIASTLEPPWSLEDVAYARGLARGAAAVIETLATPAKEPGS